jgi:hypothetical protein
MHYTSITKHDDLCSGADPAEAFELIDGNEKKAKLMDIMLDAASYINDNAKVKDYLGMQLHDAVAQSQCTSVTILKILIKGVDIMETDSKQRLPLEVAIAHKNSK